MWPERKPYVKDARKAVCPLVASESKMTKRTQFAGCAFVANELQGIHQAPGGSRTRLWCEVAGQAGIRDYSAFEDRKGAKALPDLIMARATKEFGALEVCKPRKWLKTWDGLFFPGMGTAPFGDYVLD
jgi:hypothetical protein